MKIEAPFLPGMGPEETRDDKKKEKPPVPDNLESWQIKTDIDEETCAYCEIHGSYGCPRHMKK